MNKVACERPVKRYGLMMLNKPVGPWRPTLQDAQADAIAAGMADWDPDRSALFITVPVEIVMEMGPPVPRRVAPPVATKRSFRRRRPTTPTLGRQRLGDQADR
jgi:hypothetical protein